jgi:hypothetical protein
VAWTPKAKITTVIERGRILTHAGDQVLVGSLEDEVLIWQAASDIWLHKSKTTGTFNNKSKITGVWENKIKIAA